MNNDSKNEMNIDSSELKQNANIINSHYHNDYSTYKKINNIFILNDIQNILNMFDDKFNQIIMNIHILKKKKKIEKIEYIFFNYIFELIDLLNNLEFVDQKELIEIILYLFKIYTGIPYLNFFFANFKFKNLIDLDYLIFKINQSYRNTMQNNLILKTLNCLINSNLNSYDIQTQLMIFFANMPIDFFMYYTPNNFYDLIVQNLNEILKYTTEINNYYKKNIYDFTKNYNFLINNKNDFIANYRDTYDKHLQIYDITEIDLKIKFKFNKNDIFNNFIKELAYIKKLD